MVQGLGAANGNNHALQHDEDIDWQYYQRYSFRDKEDDAIHYGANAHPNDWLDYKVTPIYEGDELIPRKIELQYAGIKSDGTLMKISCVSTNFTWRLPKTKRFIRA